MGGGISTKQSCNRRLNFTLGPLNHNQMLGNHQSHRRSRTSELNCLNIRVPLASSKHGAPLPRSEDPEAIRYPQLTNELEGGREVVSGTSFGQSLAHHRLGSVFDFLVWQLSGNQVHERSWDASTFCKLFTILSWGPEYLWSLAFSMQLNGAPQNEKLIFETSEFCRECFREDFYDRD